MPQLEIHSMSFGPYGVGRLDGKTILVPNAVTGDLLEVQISQAHSEYSIAKIERVIRPGAQRREVPCPFLPDCGGCDWQQLSYQGQLAAKGEVIAAEMRRAFGIELDPQNLVEPSPREFGYRSRLRLKVGEGGKLGFHQLASNRLVAIDHCLLAAEGLDLAPAAALARRLGRDCREIELLKSGERQVLIAHLGRAPTPAQIERTADHLKHDPRLGGVILRGGKERKVLGNAAVQFELEPGLTIEADGDSFSQINHAQNRRLIELVMKLSGAAAGMRMLDLFCGAGNLSLPAARRHAEVLGVDADPLAIAAATRNAARLGLGQARFVAMGAQATAQFLLRANYRPDVVMLDPPRTGARDVLPMIIKLRPPAVLYVSCDLSTLTRDLKALRDAGYKLESVRALDFFPNTHHAELVARAVLT